MVQVSCELCALRYCRQNEMATIKGIHSLTLSLLFGLIRVRALARATGINIVAIEHSNIFGLSAVRELVQAKCVLYMCMYGRFGVPPPSSWRR